MADDVLHHHDRAVHNHPEIQRAERQQVCGNALHLETCRGKQQRERDRQGDDNCPAHIPEKQEKNDHHQNDAFRKIVQHRVGRVLDQVTAVEKRNYLHTRRQNTLIEFFDLRVDSSECLVRICTFAQKQDA